MRILLKNLTGNAGLVHLGCFIDKHGWIGSSLKAAISD